MKSIKFLLVICLLIGLCGCVIGFRNVNEETLGDISPGMSKEEVIEAIGEPAEKKIALIQDKEYDIWTYPVERFFAGKYNPLGYLYYDIVLSGDKVKEWYKTKLYSQPQYDLEHHKAPEDATTFEIFKK